MQHTKYPLPPLMLTEIIEKCRADHECRFDYEGDQAEYNCEPSGCKWHNDTAPFIVKIEEGHGRHEHDPIEDEKGCQWRHADYQDEHGMWRERWLPREGYDKCMRDCDDSDWVVTLQYRTCGAQAAYGIKRHGDVQDVCLWAD